MSVFEAAYVSQLQGVSQQAPTLRLPGQVEEQVNMLSDAVTGLRRRPGAVYKAHFPFAGLTPNKLYSQFIEISGQQLHLFLNCATGEVKLRDVLLGAVASLQGGDYLTAQSVSSIRTAVVQDELFILNKEKTPEFDYGSGAQPLPPERRGAFYVVAGTFDQKYSLTVSSDTDSVTVSYTTPKATEEGAAAEASPEYIAEQLADALALETLDGVPMSVQRDLNYVGVSHGASNIRVDSDSGRTLMVVSKDSYFETSGDLPARITLNMWGWVVRVGSVDSPVYYRGDYERQAWLESGEYGSPESIIAAPLSVYKDEDSGTWKLSDSRFEGRTSGDDESNPPLRWMRQGITGMGVYQGRLVLLSGPMVAMSSASNPRRFFRSTVTELIDGDPIEVGASSNTAADYEYAVPFMKDLVLISRTSQALVPYTGNAITPRTATVLVTSQHAADTSSAPTVVGRTLMYTTPRSGTFFGMLEMIPSSFTDSQYTSVDVTEHLPRYFPGRGKFGASSGATGIAVFGASAAPSKLLVHEYLWSADEKVQQAWHEWDFGNSIERAYFVQEQLYMVMVRNGVVIILTLDPRASQSSSDWNGKRPFLDFQFDAFIGADGVLPIPAWLLEYDPNARDYLVATKRFEPDSGSKVELELVGGELVSPELTNLAVRVGYPFRSSFIPTEPVILDRNEQPLRNDKMTVLRYMLGLENSESFKINIIDRSGGIGDYSAGATSWSSEDLNPLEAPDFIIPMDNPPNPRASKSAVLVVPARVRARGAIFEVYTDGVGELNITSLEYVGRHNQRIRRRS